MYHGVAIVGKRFSKILRSIDSTQVAVKAAACPHEWPRPYPAATLFSPQDTTVEGLCVQPACFL